MTDSQRVSIFDKVAKTVETQYYDPNFNGTDWPRRAAEERGRIIGLADPEEFERAVHDLVRSLGSSHTGFFHESVRKVPSRLSIAATFHRLEGADGTKWYAQDVHEGGPAHNAGLRPCDQVIAVNGQPITTPEQLVFPMGEPATLVVVRDSRELPVRMDVPAPKSRKQPHAHMKSVITSKLAGNIGYLKVPVLPGMLGLDVARELDAAFTELDACDALVLDLRGHIGGGLGVLRLMSHLTARKVPIGYTLTRKALQSGRTKESLPVLDRLPTNRPNWVGIASLAWRFAGRDSSVAITTEGLGEKRWHGRLAVLINEHTISAGEMVAAFAREQSLGTLIGCKTAGRLVPASGRKVGSGFVLVLPRAAYSTWADAHIEDHGVDPHQCVSWVAENDMQRQNALDILAESGHAFTNIAGAPRSAPTGRS